MGCIFVGGIGRDCQDVVPAPESRGVSEDRNQLISDLGFHFALFAIANYRFPDSNWSASKYAHCW